MCTELEVHAIARAAQPRRAQEDAVLKGPRQITITWVMILGILSVQTFLADVICEFLFSRGNLLELLLTKVIWMLSPTQITFYIFLPSSFVLLLLITLPLPFVILLILL